MNRSRHLPVRGVQPLVTGSSAGGCWTVGVTRSLGVTLSHVASNKPDMLTLACCSSVQWRAHGQLPHEPVCTENVTPWLKLLPCRDAAGMAQLLANREAVLGAGGELERSCLLHHCTSAC